MNTTRSYRLVATATALAAPVAVSALLVPFRGTFADPAAALVLVAVVVAVATFGDRFAGLVASLSAGAWFDFFLTKPYDRFVISSAHDVETTVALVVVGLAVTEIAARGRGYYGVARAEGNILASIRDLSELVATGAPAEVVIATATASLGEVLGLEGCRFEAVPLHPRRTRLARTGELEVRGQEVGTTALPPGELEILAQCGNKGYGVFVLPVPPGHRLTIEQRVAALALADQVGAALATAPVAA